MLANALIFRQTGGIIIQHLAANFRTTLRSAQVAMLQGADQCARKARIGLGVFAAIDNAAPAIMVQNQPPFLGEDHQVEPGIDKCPETFTEFFIQEKLGQLCAHEDNHAAVILDKIAPAGTQYRLISAPG